MNTLTKTTLITALTLGTIGMASASNTIVPADNYVTTKLCVAASKGSKIKLVRAIKESGLSKQFVATNVKCNDLSLVNFIEQYGSNVEKMNNFLTSGKYSKNVVAEDLASL